jgi:RNA polymerase sigma-70 factor (ECF subfamily)
MTSSQEVSTSPTLLQLLRSPVAHEHAWRTFLERYKPLLYRWCRDHKLRNDDAEEVIAALLCKLVRVMATFEYDPSRAFRGYLRNAIHNEICTLWRRSDHRLHHVPDAVLERSATPGSVDGLVDQLDGTLERDLGVARACATRVRQRVAAHTWQAYWLTAMENEPAHAVARRLGLSVAAVYMAKSRVMKMLSEEGAKERALACHTGGAT